MIRRISLVLSFGLILGLVTGTAQSGDKKEQEKFEGAWSFVSVAGGKPNPNRAKDKKIVFKGDKMTVSQGEMKVTMTYSLDPTKKPKAMNLIMEKDGKTMTMQGIYELDGDNMKFAHFEGEKSTKGRPTDFSPSDDTVVGVLKRDKK